MPDVDGVDLGIMERWPSAVGFKYERAILNVSLGIEVIHMSNEVVEKFLEGPYGLFFGGRLTLPEMTVVQPGPFSRKRFAGPSGEIFEIGFFYSFNV